MAWIVPLPPTPRRPKPRWQVRYRDHHGMERSGGIYPTKNGAKAWKKRIEKGKLPPNQPTRTPRRTAPEPGNTQAAEQPATLATFGDFVERWWPTWKTLRPGSAAGVAYVLNHRILPTFGARPLPRADSTALAAWAEAIGTWKASMVTEGLRPHTVNGYLATLSKIINAAVDVELFDRNPIRRRSGSGRWTPYDRAGRRDRRRAQAASQALRRWPGGAGVHDSRGQPWCWWDAQRPELQPSLGMRPEKTSLDAEFGFKTVSKRFKRAGRVITRQVQVPVLTFHGLRHTHATHLIALGRPTNAVAARLGHKSIAFTMSVYASVISMAEAGRLKPKDLGLPT